ncbi:ATP-binding protein [Perlabentimonas gracilis]|uniref:ATP-binding protein n=1 Tax=Perlabentimonas gracilis TaxID=2715279 RepID=UPI00140D72C6|nr:ATP-binding protein [Perlabentimonas gracilis]NHB67939.1 ATP-binding protein [Perlabentimonas gracilis]
MFTRRIIADIKESLTFFPVVSIIGPRQVGKTTLAKQIMQDYGKPCIYLDLEIQSDLYKLNDAELFLSTHADYLVVIDEVQLKKELYPLLRGLVDQKREPARFLLLGSASPELLRHSSETLAGRIAYHQLHPLDIMEVPESVSQIDLWVKGGFPSMVTSSSKSLAQKWMDNFISTYLNRDLLQLGLNASPKVIRNLWTMMAHLNGQLLNTTTIANSLGVTSPTVKRYIDFLEEAFLLKSLQPFHWNISKRLVKSPKVYITDTGILHHLLGIADFNSLTGNPIVGSSWESFVLNQIIATKPNGVDICFYRTHQGAEVDIVFIKGLQVIATAETKFSNSPHLTKGNFVAFDDLNAPVNFVITPSSDDYLIKERVRVCSLKEFIGKYLPFFP